MANQPPRKRVRTKEPGSKAEADAAPATPARGSGRGRGRGASAAAAATGRGAASKAAQPSKGTASPGAGREELRVATPARTDALRGTSKASATAAKSSAAASSATSSRAQPAQSAEAPAAQATSSSSTAANAAPSPAAVAPAAVPSSASAAASAAAPVTAPSAASTPQPAVDGAEQRRTSDATEDSRRKGIPFLRLSANCRPTVPIAQLVYLDKEKITFGRFPTCNVVLDSKRAPQMISRNHGWLQRQEEDDGYTVGEVWKVVNNSMNGILVNGEAVGSEGRRLQQGDVVTFGRKMEPPEFEFIFESPLAPVAPAAPAPATPAPEAPGPSAEDVFAEQMKRISALQAELEAEKEEKRREKELQRAESQQRRQSALNVSDLHSELLCSICQDWLVHASTIECSHTFCWACIDKWLWQKKFECPICRHEVKREPVRSLALDTIVQKSLEKGSSEQQEEFKERVTTVEQSNGRAKKEYEELAKSVTEALRKGKAFFHIDSSWSRRERDVFQRGVKDYKGDTRETYCKLTGLTVQWVHSAGETKLNQALHNLQLANYVDRSTEDIKQRLLMYLRYG